MKALANSTIIVFKEYRQQVEDSDDRALLDRLIAALKGIRDTLGVYGKMRYQMVSFEKLLCDPWMRDQFVFEKIYASWDDFRKAFALEIGGMTVNERLYYFGLMDDYDRSCGNPEEMRTVLSAAFLSEDNIEAIIRKNRA